MNHFGDHVSNRIDPAMLEVCHADHLERYSFAKQYARGQRVLDIGCATGYGTACLADGADYTLGIDIHEGAIRYAKDHYEHPRCRFMKGDLPEVLRGEASFDLVVSFEVIEHVPDPVAFVGQIASTLKADGRVILSTPNRDVSAPAGGVSDPTHLREYTPEEFSSVLQEGGLIVESQYGLHLGESVWKRHALRAKMGRMDVLGVKRWIPGPFKAFLIHYLSTASLYVAGRPDTQDVVPNSRSQADVWIDDAVSDAYSQIAVCRNRA